MVPYRGLSLFILAVFVLGACSPTPDPEVFNDPVAMPCDEEVPWNQAIEILNSGQVESVLQLHSLEVSFVLKNGCRIRTIEPRIDDILEEVRKCGELCAMIPLGTE
jgi:hypothetical protein